MHAQNAIRVRFFRSIQGQILIWLLLLGLVPLIIMSLTFYFSSENILRNDIQTRLKDWGDQAEADKSSTNKIQPGKDGTRK